MIKLLTVLFGSASICFGYGWLLAHAFDNPSDYERQGLVRCDAPSGWCDPHERQEDPCGGKRK